ncbi:hypothetical protein FEM33_00570 [Dyadobacter flavalbus]|uniref:SCO family protein n=1 Tax=Dyadobacter flavalbus TaxID=2579942 RepID=A0A5M8R001_9BACT|nr:hypothetical protein [Dyadobacter flavalbus]KAA6441797.1 hypothetical protein FEM33_00570 [Dyadobacter flavalbus]
MLAQLQRINNLAAETSGLSIITLTGSSLGKNPDYPEELGKQNWEVQLADKEEAANAFRLLLGQESGTIENKLVLIDKEGFTRGFYNGADPEDADRLMAEIKILQYEYKNSAH